jgi:zinc transporter 9
MRYVTVLGAGLLVGTALAVIIPEGVNALYMSELGRKKNEDSIRFNFLVCRK